MIFFNSAMNEPNFSALVVIVGIGMYSDNVQI